MNGIVVLVVRHRPAPTLSNTRQRNFRFAHANGQEFTTRCFKDRKIQAEVNLLFCTRSMIIVTTVIICRGSHVRAHHSEGIGKSGIVKGDKMTMLAKEQHVQHGSAGLDENGQDHLPIQQHLLLFHRAGRFG
jgi:hypothetical protein